MISIGHTGIYVACMKREKEFYQNVFDMYVICENQLESNVLLDELFHRENTRIYTTKLITEFGKRKGTGDLLELIRVAEEIDVECSLSERAEIYQIGEGHVAFVVDDIEQIVQKICEYGGEQKTNIVNMGNGNKCCFCMDPEKNWLELIQRRG